jgi:hypothetical protein
MPQSAESCVDTDRLAALIRRQVGWQVDILQVQMEERGMILRGHAHTTLARALAEVEAARLGGLPVVENRIVVD